MTILIALQRDGVSAIISDTAVSAETATGTHEIVEGYAIKSGVLFPGCIYGFCGSVDGAEVFVSGLARKISAGGRPCEKWAALEEHIRRTSFSPAKAFVMIFATRHDGVSRLFTFDSNQDALGLQPQSGDVYLDGSGETLLAEQITALVEIVVPKIQKASRDLMSHATRDTFAYVTILSLQQRAAGGDSGLFPQHLINDELHFVAQDSNSEWRQRPMLTILGDAVGQRVRVRARRIAFQGDILVRWDWDGGESPARWHCVLPVQPGDAPLSQAARIALSDEAILKERTGPPYYFLGAGIPYQSGNPTTDCFFDVFDDDVYFADTEGYVSPTIINFIGHTWNGTLRTRELPKSDAYIASDAEYRHWKKKCPQ